MRRPYHVDLMENYSPPLDIRMRFDESRENADEQLRTRSCHRSTRSVSTGVYSATGPTAATKALAFEVGDWILGGGALAVVDSGRGGLWHIQFALRQTRSGQATVVEC